MEILTAAEMAAVDRRTAEDFGVPMETLMENAGRSVAEFCLRQYPAARRVTVLCGRGNNGGDGFVAARILAQDNVLVRVVLLGRADEVKGDAAQALQRMRDEVSPAILDEVVDEAGLRALEDIVRGSELILDAVVGTGFKAPLRGLAAVAGEMIAKLEVPVVAVDLPSGWDADSVEETAEGAYRASAVVTFTRPKRAHVFGNLTGGAFGPVVVAGIGSPDAAVSLTSRLRWTGTAKAIAESPREVNANKGKYGHVLVVGGSYGTAGAPSMAAMAAMRTGAGLVTAAVPKSVEAIVAGVAPELMLAGLKEGEEGEISLGSLGAVEELIKAKRISTVAVGPGLSTKGEASEFARGVVARARLPMVVDADALNAFDGRAVELKGDGRVMVLTPHPGEMARLLGMTIAEVEKDREGLARRFATEHKVTLVLKGWRTLVAHPDGTVAVNTSGNPAMAKGGSGDILTGIVAAMLAQYAQSGHADDVARAVETAVFLHGLAGDFAADAMDEHTVLAMDTVKHLSDAFRYRVKDRDGLVWICGLNNARSVR